jgi:predicted amidophosphoribosyltransferase
MKFESCRRCGKEMEIDKNCNVCLKPSQLFCHGCGFITDEQIHLNCLMIKSDKTLVQR